MAVAEVEGQRIRVISEFREKELIKQIPGARWEKDAKAWYVPLSWAACVQLRGVFGADLSIGNELNAYAAAEISSRIQPCMALRGADDSERLSMLTKLFPYQRADADFLLHARLALCANEMGTGKTIITIGAMSVCVDTLPALIICPNSVKYNWQEEFETWAPHIKTTVITGGAAARRKAIAQVQGGEAQVGIINWEALRYHTKLAPWGSVVRVTDDEKTPKELNEVQWKTIVADEAHRAKEPKSKQTRALWAVGHMPSVEYRWALTGTPVANTPEDLWAIMHFVAPLEWPTKSAYIDRYALQSWNLFGGMSAIGIKTEMKDEFFRILDPRFIRRLREITMSDPAQASFVPPKMPPTTRHVDMEAKQKKAYDQLRKEMLAELDSGVLMATNPLTRLVRLLQFASAYGELSPQTYNVGYQTVKDGIPINIVLQAGFATIEEAAAFQQANPLSEEGQETLVSPDKRDLTLSKPSNKVNAALDLAEELGDTPAVFFAESRQLIEMTATALRKAGYKAVEVTGSISPELRAVNVKDFQEGKAQFILLTLGAGGEGLTLTAASTCIFLQRSFSLIKNKQAEDRLPRPGQKFPVQYIDVVTKDSIESRVHELVHEKGALLEEVVRDQEAIRAWLSK